MPLALDEFDGIALRDFNIVHYRNDLTNIKEALASIPKRQDRPKVKKERCTKIARTGDVCAASDGSSLPSAVLHVD